MFYAFLALVDSSKFEIGRVGKKFPKKSCEKL
jgi:hypothetical protein